ncbi:3-hydroxyisobutyrate dehydrogenase [Microcella alkaliphila]|uniref:3-hydroxyisobutyrate dehydrogenase n=1 Tax=Microcella alkaliphila TaxID=279828 RepID=A0A4Q7U0X9_9MICO|nr:NAD(P)-dependent oxidoreductase [Microcella alkaliphila]RZT66410.1 3-hydroxyisobutyrate dehydrogenase [Microcella alkaliphila]
MTTSSTLFIGLGKMGLPMARRHAAVFPTYVYDVDPGAVECLSSETGITGLPSLSVIPPDINTVILMLPNSHIVESVLVGSEPPGLMQRLTEGSLIIDMGSSEPESTRSLAGSAAALGIHFTDAPVSGGVAKALEGQLSIMIGGTPEAIYLSEPHLKAMGSHILVVGPSGAGHAAKALNNLLSATNLAAAAEVLCVAQAQGIDPETMINVINASTSRSQASEFKYPKHILTGTFDSGFAMDLMIKDLKIAMGLIQDQNLHAPVTAAANDAANEARNTLESEDPDHTELARYYENINGSKLRSATSHAPSIQEQDFDHG